MHEIINEGRFDDTSYTLHTIISIKKVDSILVLKREIVFKNMNTTRKNCSSTYTIKQLEKIPF